MIDLMPYDVQEKIFSYLNLKDLIRTSLVNKRLKAYLDGIAENPYHLRFRKLFIFITPGLDLKKNPEFSYPDSIEVESIEFIKHPNFRKLFAGIEFLVIYSRPISFTMVFEINYGEYLACFKKLKYLEFNHPARFKNPLRRRTLKNFKQELVSGFKHQIENLDEYITLSSNRQKAYLIEKKKIRDIRVARSGRQFKDLPDVKFLHLKECLNHYRICEHAEEIKPLKCLKLNCIGIGLRKIFEIQAELEAQNKVCLQPEPPFVVMFSDQVISRDIVNLQLLEKIQCPLDCMDIQLVMESSILEFIKFARQYEFLYDYVVLLNYRSNSLGLRDLARFRNLRVLYISKWSLNENEIQVITSSFKSIEDLQIVATRIQQSFYEAISDNFPHLKLLSITNCPVESFDFLNKLPKVKKVVINRTAQRAVESVKVPRLSF